MFKHTMLDKVISVRPKLGLEPFKFESYPNFTFMVPSLAH